ncbi:hypothetical protein [Salinirussus salinus]|uniref:hypothetical protein n=1 Tax=Salinirussus salinus TaxID=1198300 RepID=UPI001357C0EB|nr:hypothetical protein [Salinirussus salinus]
MDLVEPPGHLGGLDLADRCNTPVLADLLEERDLLGYGQLLDGSLTERDTDRCRIAKFIASKSEGTPLKHVVSYAVKGVSPEACERVEGSDPDYQFAYRFVDDLASHDPPLVEKSQDCGVLMVTPELPLIDLITEGISETVHRSDDTLRDGDFLRKRLQTVSKVDDDLRERLEDRFTSYLDRIDDYRLLFDVHLVGRGTENKRQMTKRYKTRFNDPGRIRKQFARFNDALEHGYKKADNAVLVTYTTDPKRFPNLLEAIESINPNFHRLQQYLSSDPSTKSDTRQDSVLNWRPELDDEVTGRPRESLDYIKALEFTEKGYPHLHVLYFDVPTREKDGMPWLCDKAELSSKWMDYGQGRIVDTYPLTYRDDLDDLDPEFDQSEGFVDWYRFGDHGHGEDWIRQQTRTHELIEFDDDAVARESTAGKYLGKYLSATFGSLLEATESFQVDDNSRDSYADKAATWKLALYWLTNKQFWSCSETVTGAIDPNDHVEQDPDVRQAVRDCSLQTLHQIVCPELYDSLARRSWNDLTDLNSAVKYALSQIDTPILRSTLPAEKSYRIVIDYIGAYAQWDLPVMSIGPQPYDLETVEEAQSASSFPTSNTNDRL